MAKNNNKVGFMLEVVMRRNDHGDTSYIMMPGQAFPIEPRDANNNVVGVTQIWLYSALMSNGKFYTNVNSAPISLAELQASGMYNSATTSNKFGLSVYTIDPNVNTGLFTASDTMRQQRNIWYSQMHIGKYVELQRMSMAKPFESSIIFTPYFYAKLKDGVNPNLSMDVKLWDATCGMWQYFRKTDIPIVLDDYVAARRCNALWSKSTMGRSPDAVKGYYLEAWQDEIQTDHLFIAYDEPPLVGICERLYTRAKFNEERTFYGSTYRRYIEVPYVEGDILKPIDSGRIQARHTTLDTIVNKAADRNYLEEL